MERERKTKLMWCWSLLTAGLIALFWTIWYLNVGSVPVFKSIKMTPNWTLELPFGISRWWDILIGPIWSVILIPLFINETIRKNKDFIDNLVFGLAFGLGFSLGFGLFAGLDFSLVFGLGFGLFLGLVFSLSFGLGFGLDLGLVFGLGFSLGFSLFYGLGFSLFYGLGFSLFYGLGFLLMFVFSKPLWSRIYNYFLAKEGV